MKDYYHKNSHCGLFKKLVLLAGIAGFIAFVVAVIVKAVKALHGDDHDCCFDDELFDDDDDDDDCVCGCGCEDGDIADDARQTDKENGFAQDQDFEQE